jgi:hypothetical protein
MVDVGDGSGVGIVDVAVAFMALKSRQSLLDHLLLELQLFDLQCLCYVVVGVVVTITIATVAAVVAAAAVDIVVIGWRAVCERYVAITIGRSMVMMLMGVIRIIHRSEELWMIGRHVAALSNDVVDATQSIANAIQHYWMALCTSNN